MFTNKRPKVQLEPPASEGYDDSSRKSTPLRSYASRKLSRPRPASVLVIERSGGQAQVINPVVRPDAVLVVNDAWGTPVDVHPCQPMRSIPNFVYVDVPIPILPLGTRNLANFNASGKSAGFCFPSKDSSGRVVIKNFMQACCGKIGFTHDAPCKRIGQRPGRVISTSRLRYFTVRLNSSQHGLLATLQDVWPKRALLKSQSSST